MTAKTRGNGTMSEAQYLAWVRSALRSRWLKWPARAKCIELARRPYKGPNKLQKWEVQCAICKEWFKLKEIEVDHYPKDCGTIESIKTIGTFVENLFCEIDNLRVLCRECHSCWTYCQRQNISFEEAKLTKQAIEICRNKSKTVALLKSLGYTDSEVSNDTKRRQLVVKYLKEKAHD